MIPERVRARDLVGYGRFPPRFSWPEGARLVVNVVLVYEEGSEYSVLWGDDRNDGWGEYPDPGVDPPQRDPGTESHYEYGSRAGVWRLARIFDAASIPITVSAAAVALELNLPVAEWMRERDHDLLGHGWRWIELWQLSREEEREHLRRAIATYERVLGQRPLGWNCRGWPSENTRELLVEEGGFLYDADAYNDDLPYFTEVKGKRHLIVPYSLVYNDGRIIAQGYGGLDDFYEYCQRGLDELWREGDAGYPKMMTIGLHPRWMGQAARTNVLRQFVEYALEKGDVWFARRIDIARWWLEHSEEFAAT